jgi:hypothetical protein
MTADVVTNAIVAGAGGSERDDAKPVSSAATGAALNVLQQVGCVLNKRGPW